MMLAELVEKGGLRHSGSQSELGIAPVAEVATVAVADGGREEVRVDGWREQLAPLPLMRDDNRFIEEQMRHVISVPKRFQLAAEYRNHWERAARQQGVSYRKENAGRFAANNYLRKEIDDADSIH